MIFFFKLAARLPLWSARVIGLMLGWLVWMVSPRYRVMMRRNWRMACESGRLGQNMRRDASRMSRAFCQAVGHAGLIAAELPRIWCDPSAAQRMPIHGLDEALATARERGRGLIFLTPHLGAFELSARAFSLHMPITVLYRPPRQAGWRRLMERLRPMQGLHTAPTDAAGVRQLLRALRRGEAVGMLPDQVPGRGEGVWAGFFGAPAYTMTLPLRLAQATGAQLMFALAIRTASGWELELTPWNDSPDFDRSSPEEAASRMNAALEAQIARAPEQYLWAYNRYKRPAGAPPPPPILSAPSAS
jgi:KDO2-lipid IV(A) lauroyltransferase